MYSPGTPKEHHSWTRGIIRKTIARSENGTRALHVVTINGFKWDQESDWGEYDGVPEVLGREVDGGSELEFVDTWPRRHA